MTAKKKTKKQTPQAVLDLIARQEGEIDRVRRQRDECIAMNNKNADAVNHWKREVSSANAALNVANANRAKEVESLQKALTDAGDRCLRDRDIYSNSLRTLEAKLRETEQQVGKLLADAKRARDEQRRDRVYVLTWQALGETPCVTGVFATLEDGKNHVNSYHGVEAKWLDGARAQLVRNGACVGQYILSLRNVQPQP